MIMPRIFEINGVVLDLANIKVIKSDPFGSHEKGCKITIEFLTGKEFLYHEDSGSWKLIDAKITIFSSTPDAEAAIIGELSRAWEMCLAGRNE